jgi:hypothetical protein
MMGLSRDILLITSRYFEDFNVARMAPLDIVEPNGHRCVAHKEPRVHQLEAKEPRSNLFPRTNVIQSPACKRILPYLVLSSADIPERSRCGITYQRRLCRQESLKRRSRSSLYPQEVARRYLVLRPWLKRSVVLHITRTDLSWPLGLLRAG